jgi:hypothetical protein
VLIRGSGGDFFGARFSEEKNNLDSSVEDSGVTFGGQIRLPATTTGIETLRFGLFTGQECSRTVRLVLFDNTAA